MTKLMTLLALMGSLAFTVPVEAQKRDDDRKERAEDIPKSHRPPPGMCRIWLDGVAPAQQPAPTDCATAIKRRPTNGSLVFGQRVRGEWGIGRFGEGLGVRHVVPVGVGNDDLADLPAALLGRHEQMHEIGVRDAEDGVDAFGLEEFQDAFVDFGAHDGCSVDVRDGFGGLLVEQAQLARAHVLDEVAVEVGDLALLVRIRERAAEGA